MIIANTPYDDVFKTLLNDCSRLFIPVINEAFHESYTGDEKIALLQNEHLLNRQGGEQEKRITDSLAMIGDDIYKQYHCECETNPDNTIAIRLFEYDSGIAINNSRIEGNKLIITFPKTAVLFLRSNSNTPDEMVTRIEAMNGKALEYTIPVMKVKNYTVDEIFDKELLFLIPFYIFIHESRFSEYNGSEEAMKPLLEEYEKIKTRLEELRDAEKIDERTRHTIIDMSNKVLENIAQNYENVRKGVHDVMGGQVLEYETKTIWNSGKQEKAKEMALRMHDEGDSVERIAKIANETIDTIQKWLNEMEN